MLTRRRAKMRTHTPTSFAQKLLPKDIGRQIEFTLVSYMLL